MILWRRVDSEAAAMNFVDALFAKKSRLRALLDHFAVIKDPREPCEESERVPGRALGEFQIADI